MSSSSSSSRTRSRYHSNRQESDQIVAHFNGSNENLVHIKFLLPGSVTGSVIGKGGEKIASLQKQTNTKMKMSKAGDYFPGTEERVCLVIGTIDNILSVYEFLSDRIRENLPSDLIRSRQIKLIIPNATAGVVIGKGGSTIESIKHTTNASLTIAPKCDMSERVMTITGEDEVRLKALAIVLEKVQEDPHHDSQPNVNYSNEKHSSINEFAHHGLNGKSNDLIGTSDSSSMPLELIGLERLAQLIINAGGTNQMTVDSLIISLRLFGFADPSIREIIHSINTLINYRLISVETTNIYSPSSSIFSSARANYRLSERDRQENCSQNSTNMNYKRFKSDQQRTGKTKR